MSAPLTSSCVTGGTGSVVRRSGVGPYGRARAALGATALVAVLGATTACIPVTVDDKQRPFFRVVNGTSEPITIFVEGVDRSNQYARTDVRPGESRSYVTFGCLGTTAVATDADGRELSRLPGGLCEGGFWTFTARGAVIAGSETGPGSTLAPSAVPPSQRPPYSSWWSPGPPRSTVPVVATGNP